MSSALPRMGCGRLRQSCARNSPAWVAATCTSRRLAADISRPTWGPPRPLKSAPSRPCRTYSTAGTSVSASELMFGQPVHETHPHLLEAGELTPGISAQEFHERRARLCHSLPGQSAVLLPAASLKYRSGAVFHAFRQESNMLYLTGFSEPESMAVLRRTGDDLGDYEMHLFCRPKDPRAEQWKGPWSGLDAARDVWNADVVADIGRAEPALAEALRGVDTLYTDADLTRHGQATPLGQIVQAAMPSGASTQVLRPHINALRAIKSPAEVANMRRAGRDSGRALTDAMRQPWHREKDLAAFLDYRYHAAGLDGSAYVPVVAGGPRASLIHYVLNNAALDPSELILVDAGGEYGTYISDITRTWPASGRFSPPQRDLYLAVLNAQRAAVAMCRADADVTLDGLHRVAENAMRDQLRQLGFDNLGGGMSGGRGVMDALFPHHVGHYVGLDVHDTPGYPRSTRLREGHCITIEPGIYVPEDDRFPAAFRGLGIRIEDSVCIGEKAPIVLTAEAVKEVDDIEALRS